LENFDADVDFNSAWGSIRVLAFIKTLAKMSLVNYRLKEHKPPFEVRMLKI
jgi:hypothetical protein